MYKGIACSVGIGIGNVVIIEEHEIVIENKKITDTDAEIARLQGAIEKFVNDTNAMAIYVTISYVARIALKSFLKKKGFGTSKKSLLVIAPDAMLRETLRTVEKSCIGYTRIVAASLDTDMKGKTICSIPIVANHDGIVDYACDEWVDEVLIPPCSEDEYPDFVCRSRSLRMQTVQGLKKAWKT